MKALIELHFQRRASLKMYFGQRFHTPMKLQKNAFNSAIIVLIFMIYYDFVVFRSQFQENTILFVKSFLSKALKAIISSKLGE